MYCECISGFFLGAFNELQIAGMPASWYDNHME